MRKGFTVAMAVFMLAAMFSCSSGRLNGFSYRPAHPGPDMGGSIHHSTNMEQPKLEEAPVMAELTEAPSTTDHLSGITPSTEMSLLATVAEEQARQLGPEETVTTREAVRTVAERYAAEKNIELTPGQYRKLDRAARKLERKQAEVNWGPENNLEIFLLAAAAVGLVVGIVGAAFGWFIFLVAALVYLYFKLLK